MYLIAGLGNPGDKYRHTRHNIGFIFLDYLANRCGFAFGDSKWQAATSLVRLWGDKIIFVKPTTFMNLSGVAVGQVAAYYKIPPENIIVIHDDLDLPPGRLKMVCKRGAGGHNGVSSIIDHLASKNFVRMRIGVGRPVLSDIKVSNFVLGKISNSEERLIVGLYDDLVKGVGLFMEDGLTAAMNYLNSIKP